MSIFELVFEYRSLLAKHRAEGAELGLPARSRLDALHRLLGREPTDAQGTRPGELGRRKHARCDVHFGALLRHGPRTVAVEVVNLGAGGVCIAETTWRSEDEHLSGLRFIGAPLNVLLAS